MRTYIQIHPADNVAVALTDLQAGCAVETEAGRTVVLQEAVPAGHKIALCDLAAGAQVVKYGAPIGHAVADIPAGCAVNEKNIRTNLDGLCEYTYTPDIDIARRQTAPAPDTPLTFQGYRRRNGLAGIRNELWIVPTVGCVNGTAQQLARLFRSRKWMQS